jgi:hypothetical protein
MSGAELAQRLADEYDRESGFLGRLRSGQYDQARADRFLATWQEIDLGRDDDPVDRELVKAFWFTPVFIGWQLDRLEPKDRRLAKNLLNQVQSVLES